MNNFASSIRPSYHNYRRENHGRKREHQSVSVEDVRNLTGTLTCQCRACEKIAKRYLIEMVIDYLLQLLTD